MKDVDGRDVPVPLKNTRHRAELFDKQRNDGYAYSTALVYACGEVHPVQYQRMRSLSAAVQEE